MEIAPKIKRLKANPLIANILKRLEGELPSGLSYHNLTHTLDVLNEVVLFASIDTLSERDIELLAVGAAFHDAGFIEQVTNNEAIGAQMAKVAMQESAAYTESEIEQVVEMIEDTELKQTENGPAQLARSDLSKYLLDADLSNLGREDFFEKTQLVGEELGIPVDNSFFQNVLVLMKSHRWYTSAAQKLRQTQKELNISELERRLS